MSMQSSTRDRPARTRWLRPLLPFGTGIAALVGLTVVLFTVDLVGTASLLVQLAWVLLVTGLCLAGARAITRRVQGARVRPRMDGAGQRDEMRDFDLRSAKGEQHRLPW